MKNQTSLHEEVTKLVGQCKGDQKVLYQKMTYGAQLHQSQKTKLLNELEQIKDGNNQQIEKFVYKVQQKGKIQEYKDGSSGPMVGSLGIMVGGGDQGETKIQTHWWGVEFYFSHQLIQSIFSLDQFVKAVTDMGGLAATLLVPLSPTLILSIAALKLLDKGRGIIITMYAYLPPPIPSTQ